MLYISTLANAISISFIQPKSSLAFLDRDDERDIEGSEDSFLTSSGALETIHSSIMAAASSGCVSVMPSVLAWIVVLRQMYFSYTERAERRDHLIDQSARETFQANVSVRPMGRRNSADSTMSMEAARFDAFFRASGLDKDMAIVEDLATDVTAAGVYDVITQMTKSFAGYTTMSLSTLIGTRIRIKFLHLVETSMALVGYHSETVTCITSILDGGESHFDYMAQEASLNESMAHAAVEDGHLSSIVGEALMRFPFECVPFVKFCQALATGSSDLRIRQDRYVVDLLHATPTLTVELPYDQDFDMIGEEDTPNLMMLTADLELIRPQEAHRRAPIHDDLRVPAGTIGRFITEDRVVALDCEYSALAMLGTLLELSVTGEASKLAFRRLEPEEITEIISLLAILLRAETPNAGDGRGSNVLVAANSDTLAVASRHIRGRKDIFSIICDIISSHLQDDSTPTSDASVATLGAGIRFLHAALPQNPTRVISFVARSGLLNSEMQAGRLSKIIGNLDLVIERYGLLLSTLRLFDAIVDSVMKSAAQRRLGNQYVYKKGEENTWAGLSERVVERVCHGIAQVAVNCFENSTTWRFTSDSHRGRLVLAVTPILNKIVSHAYALGEDDSNNLLGSMRPAALYILESFLEPAAGTLRFQTILGTFCDAFTSSHSTVMPRKQGIVREQVKMISEFARTLLRASSLSGQSCTHFAIRLFKAGTLIFRSFGAFQTSAEPVLQLLETMVESIAIESDEPPSLIGFLGNNVAKSVLDIVGRMDMPFDSAREAIAFFKFGTAIVSSRQHWMSSCIITGRTPRNALENPTDAEPPESVLQRAMQRLRRLFQQRQNIQTMGLVALQALAMESLALLEFITAAQNHWPRSIVLLEKDATFFDSLTAYTSSLQPSDTTARLNPMQACIEAKQASYIAQIFAMQLYHMRQMGKSTQLATRLIQHIDYYLREGALVRGYNRSLHSNFGRNFTNKYPGCNLSNFKRSLVEPATLGNAYYYDIDRANDMFRFDSGWAGPSGGGFRAEMELGNTNLSLVDAQIVSLLGPTRLLSY